MTDLGLNNINAERLIAINKIGMGVDKVLEAAKTITTIRIRMPENGTYFTKTLFFLTSSLFCAIIWRRMKINELRRING